jgi:sigma-B regulation protein RsbU (phosphoserine phosphatase)
MTGIQKKTLHHTLILNSVVLIVDDSETTRIILRSFCQRAGFQSVHEATNGQEALDFIRKNHTDLVFLDIEMPVMDGLTLCDHLRAEGYLEKLIVIMQTASDRAELKAKAFGAGVTDLIAKPLEARETVARMLAHLERRHFYKKAEEDFQRLREELNEAVMLQALLQPDDRLIAAMKQDLGIDAAHYYHPATELGGDYISVRRLPDERVALIAADVAGHGLSAALYAFAIHTLLDDKLLATCTPAAMLTKLNDKLYDFMSAGKFATAWIAIVDTQAKTIEYASAASPPVLLISAGNYTKLESRGHLLGVEAQANYTDYRLSYRAGDILCIYSDALIESPNAQGVAMPEKEIAEIIMRDTSKPSAASHLKHIMTGFYSNYTDQPADDVSMIVCVL